MKHEIPSWLIDTHAHLADEAFASDIEEVLQRAHDAGVHQFITVAETEQVWERNREIAERNQGVSFTIGIHPHEADRYGSVQVLKQLKEKCVRFIREHHPIAVGEMGLDYYKRYADAANQKKLFEIQLGIAEECILPIVIHCRQAYPDLIHMLEQTACYRRMPKPGVIHCFSGTLEDAERLCAMGFMLGIDGPVTYPKTDKFKGIVKNIPLGYILLETDCPYLPPQQCRGKRNEPAYLSWIAGEIASIKNEDVAVICTVTTKNAQKTFGLMPDSKKKRV